MNGNTTIRTPEDQALFDLANANVYHESPDRLEGHAEVKGYDFNNGLDYEKVFKSYLHTGFQASYLGESIEIVNKMIKWRLSDEPVKDGEDEDLLTKEARDKVRCTIFLGYTSNMVSCGMREYIKYLCQHKMIDCIVTTTGGIEEDFMKCLAPHYMGDFYLKGKDLRLQGVNRTGNLLVPNSNYVKFEAFLGPIVEELHKEQKETGEIFTPSKIIRRMGQKINNPDSIYYWCA
jgi:deoxyhypusine synthase